MVLALDHGLERAITGVVLLGHLLAALGTGVVGFGVDAGRAEQTVAGGAHSERLFERLPAYAANVGV